jgi:hypothetical protein
MIYNAEKVEMLRQQFPEGTRICLDYMDDPNPIESGTNGRVDFVDDAGTVHCKFDNGRTLGVIPGEDQFHITEQKLDKADEQTKENENETEDLSEKPQMDMTI